MKKRVLEISSGIVHPSLMARWYLHRMLKLKYQVEVDLGIAGATRLIDGIFDAVVVYLHRRHIPDQALEALEGFVAAGGGLLAIHSATASFKQCRRWFELLGGRFLSHAKVMDFEIIPKKVQPDLFGSIGGCRVHDELYVHEVKDDITVHFSAYQQRCEVPVVWTRTYGQGRVCYLGPGHCAATIKHPIMEALIMQGLQWISGQEGG